MRAVCHYTVEVWKECVFKGVYLKKGEYVKTDCHLSDPDFQALLHYDFFGPNATPPKDTIVRIIEPTYYEEVD